MIVWDQLQTEVEQGREEGWIGKEAPLEAEEEEEEEAGEKEEEEKVEK